MLKFTQQQAGEVLKMFQKHLSLEIRVTGYRTEDFFHVFEIEPISINGIQKNQIRFKDTLVVDCINTKEILPDVKDLVNVCFH